MKFPSPIAAVSFSPRSDFLATSLIGSNAIYLWANALYFSNLFLKSVGDSPVEVELPKITDGEKEREEEEEDGEEEEEANKMDTDVDELTRTRHSLFYFLLFSSSPTLSRALAIEAAAFRRAYYPLART